MSGDLLLILDRRDMLVRLEGNALRVERPDGALQRVPLGLLGMVVVYGAPAVTCDVWRALAERYIPAVLLPVRGKGATAWLGPGLSATIQIRCRQHQTAAAVNATLGIARELVKLKLVYQCRLAGGLPEGYPGRNELVETFERRIAALAEARDVAALMGLEGTAAAAWYAWLAEHLPGHWRFSGRNRRPPRDPLNALLSLGYTLLLAEMGSAVQEAGLDPALGFLHGIVPGRESLVLDLMEPLRPGVDALMLSLLDKVLQPGHFADQGELGCRLTKEGRGLFYPAWAAARWQWPLPISPYLGLSLKSEEVELQAGDTVESVGDPSLRTQCRRMVRVLRTLLQGGAIDLDEEVFSDG